MRDVLYHGKRKDNGEWVEGYYSPANIPLMGCIGHFINQGGYRAIEVEPESVGEFAGMNDRIGKKMFEKDVVKVFLFPYPDDNAKADDIGVIVFRDGAFGIKFSTKFEGCDHFMPLHAVKNYYNGEFEIIGNIADNPEMEKMTIWEYI